MPDISDLFAASQLSQLNFDTPFMLTDIERARKNYNDLRIYFPGAAIHYAMKSNPDKQLLKALYEAGSSFEIASYGELELLLALDIPADTILYSNPVKPPDHIAKAFKAGIRAFVFDSVNELQKLAQQAPGAEVYLRIKVGDKASVFPLSSKFGAEVDDTVSLMQTAKELGLNPQGLTFHVGSQSTDTRTWQKAIATAARCMRDLEHAGIRLTFLDIGGGLPADYGQHSVTATQLAVAIQHALHAELPYAVDLYIEPGRFIAADTSVIAATVIGREHRGKEEWLYLDIGAFQGLIEYLEMPGWVLPIYTSDTYQKMAPFTLTGPTCDSQDTLGHGIMLPETIDVGDRVYIGQTGAYTLPYAAPSFNGFAPPKVYYTHELN